jgi:uroporphyrin-III C-methyltransferase/precorrin-2 dehydrogenase/sirohydrochlorin ferrochelatase
VVPGITAATAVAASLQVPLTHRDHARSVTFLSGHTAGDGEPDFDQIDFGALAGRGATLAVYMGLSTAPALAARLLADGWSPATPVIAVGRVTQAGERRVATTLDVLASHATGFGLSGPALLIVGEVASLPMAGAVEQLEASLAPSDAHCASGANSSPSFREPVHA